MSVTINVDTVKGIIRLKGKLFLGGRIAVETNAADGTLFYLFASDKEGRHNAVATHEIDAATNQPIAVADGACVFDLNSISLRNAFESDCAQAFDLYAIIPGERTTAVGAVTVDWSPVSFETDGTPVSMRGADGADGKSAYEVALDDGFVGTRSQWLASLKGADGRDGTDGAPGEKGERGEIGAQGATGIQGAPGPKGDKGDKGDTGATGAQGPQGVQGLQGLTGPRGEKGERGERGPQGQTGIQGIPGRDGKDGAKGEPGNASTALAGMSFDIDAGDGQWEALKTIIEKMGGTIHA